MIFLEIINETELSYAERIELYLDAYGNCMNREKTFIYIQELAKKFMDVASQTLKNKTYIEKYLDFSLIKYKDRDEITEYFKLWHSKEKFDIEKLRDQRLRYHYKQRYDFRQNLVDWDFNMYLLPLTKIIHISNFRKFRLTGLSFETRQATYPCPNRTLATYIPGKNKKTLDNIEVLGFWGDILMSPYFAHGVEVTEPKEKTEFYKTYNLEYVFNSISITEFHIRRYLTKLETLIDYHPNFTDKTPEQRDKEKAEKENTIMSMEDKDYLELQLKIAEENKLHNSLVIKEKKALKAFDKLKVKFFFLSGDIQPILEREKFKNLIDVVVIGINSDNLINEKLSIFMKKKGIVYIETLANWFLLKKEERDWFSDKLKEMAEKVQLKEVTNLTHHLIFQLAE